MAKDTSAVIGKAITVRGEIEGREDLQVEGVIEGRVRLEAELRVATGGKVTGEVWAKVLTVEGRFDGTAECDEVAHLQPGCDATGTLTSPRVVIEDGAVFNGTLDMDVGPEPVPGEVRNG